MAPPSAGSCSPARRAPRPRRWRIGFRATENGLVPIAGGSQPLSAAASSPEDVAISPDDTHVVVTEKNSNTIDTFALSSKGALAPAVTSPSDSPLAFAEVFTPSGQLLVADDGANGTSAVSSYHVGSSGTLSATQAAVSDGQSAACWIATGQNGNCYRLSCRGKAAGDRGA